jgi:hypothetical protein
LQAFARKRSIDVMDDTITTRRLWAGLALELAPLAMFGLGLRMESAWWRRSDLLYDVGVVLFIISLVSGLGWVAVGNRAAALAAFAWRALFITVTGAALWMDGHRGAPLWWWAQLGWFAAMTFPVVSALLLWRWAQSVAHAAFSDEIADGTAGPSAKSV